MHNRNENIKVFFHLKSLYPIQYKSYPLMSANFHDAMLSVFLSQREQKASCEIGVRCFVGRFEMAFFGHNGSFSKGT